MLVVPFFSVTFVFLKKVNHKELRFFIKKVKKALHFFNKCFFRKISNQIYNKQPYSGLEHFKQLPVRIFLFSGLFIFFSCSIAARDKFHRSPGSVRVELNTDVLSILNSVLSKHDREISLSGEVAFNRRFGMLLHLLSVKTKEGQYKSESILGSAEFRWYFQCDCYSASHAGIYSGLMNKATVDQRQHHELFFENGLAGGYKLMIGDSWYIDPSATLGISTQLQKSSANTIETVYDPQST